MKPKYLIDACLSLKKGVCDGSEFVLAQDVLGEGTPDSEVLDYAMKKNLVLITNDMKFALRIAMKNQTALFYTRGGKSFLINAQETPSAKFSDSLSFYAVENDEVVMP